MSNKIELELVRDYFIHNKDEIFLEIGDTLKTPNRFGNVSDNISNRICKLVKNDYFGTVVEIDGKECRVYLNHLSLTKETKIKTLSKQIALIESKLKEKKDKLEMIMG